MKKVTLKELVAGKIIFAVLVFCVPRYPGVEI